MRCCGHGWVLAWPHFVSPSGPLAVTNRARMVSRLFRGVVRDRIGISMTVGCLFMACGAEGIVSEGCLSDEQCAGELVCEGGVCVESRRGGRTTEGDAMVGAETDSGPSPLDAGSGPEDASSDVLDADTSEADLPDDVGGPQEDTAVEVDVDSGMTPAPCAAPQTAGPGSRAQSEERRGQSPIDR